MGIYEISQSFGIRQADHVRHVLALGRETYNDRKISYRLDRGDVPGLERAF